MNRFFRRIFLAFWVMGVATVILAYLVANLLHLSAASVGKDHYEKQLVATIARDLRGQLATGPSPAAAVATVGQRHLLEVGDLLRIFIIDPEGRDIAGRPLPAPVARLMRPEGAEPAGTLAFWAPPLTVQSEGLHGYRIVGYPIAPPVGRTLLQPHGRALMMVVSILVSAIISLVLARFIALPIQRLRKAGQRVAAGDLSVRVAHTLGRRTDDIAKLAQDFDVMTGRVEHLIASQQQLMRDVSHELRSPLARIQAILSIARQKARQDDMANIDRMEHEVERLNALIGEILSFARLQSRQQVEPCATDLVDLVRTIVEDAHIEGRESYKDVRMSGPDRCVVSVDTALIHRAVENIVRNALKYTAEYTAVEIAITVRDDAVTVTVDDRGPGVPEAALEKLYMPFYRVNEVQNHSPAGSGVGLAIAERSVSLHGGSIRASNRDGGGLSVEISLPQESGGSQSPAS
ncbi:ATP-binding protein [Exilibacterium tricleocarpae]|nr:ATP-binding protein [Exilibacterium tricleocarpae]